MNILKKVTNDYANFLGGLFNANQGLQKGRDSQTPPVETQGAEEGQLVTWMQSLMSSASTRKAKYSDYDTLDDEPLPGRALDVYASLITQGEIEEGEESTSFNAVTKNSKQGKLFEEMEIRTNLKGKLFRMARSMCKYGMNPQEVVFKEFVGIKKLRSLDPVSFRLANERLDVEDSEYPYILTNMDTGEVKAKFKSFQVLWLRLMDDESRLYGKSILDTVRKTSKVVDVLENSIAFRELNRAIQKWLWLVDSTGLNPEEATKYVEKVMRKHQKPKYIDYKGQLNLSRTPLTDMGDIGLPVYKEGAPVDIRPLAADRASASLEVLQHFANKFFGGVGIPNYYFSQEGARQIRSASALSYTDILLAKCVFRFQSAITSELYDMYLHESQFHGIDDGDFKLVFPVMGTVDEMMKYQILNLKVQIANTLRVNMKMVDDEWVYTFLKFAQKDLKKFNAFRSMVRGEEKFMLQASADGVFVQPIMTMGNPGDSPFDIITPVMRQEFQPQPPQQAGPGMPSQGESLLVNHDEVVSAASHSMEAAQMQVMQERLRSERTFQALLDDIKVRNLADNIAELSKFRMVNEDPFNTGVLGSTKKK